MIAYVADCSRQQISVDVYFCPQQFIDVATIGNPPHSRFINNVGTTSQFTGGQVYYYPAFKPAVDSERLIRDISRNITRETGFEAVMRVRMSKGFIFIFISNPISKVLKLKLILEISLLEAQIFLLFLMLMLIKLSLCNLLLVVQFSFYTSLLILFRVLFER